MKVNDWLDNTFLKWESIIRDNEVLTDDIIICHLSKDTVFLNTLLKVSKKAHDQGRCRSVFILSSGEEGIEYLTKETSDFIKIVISDTETLESFARLYCINRFYNRLFFDSFSIAQSSDPMRLLGVNGITDTDIACVAVFNMPFLLNSENDITNPFSSINLAFVDWEKHNASSCYSGCSSYTDILKKLKNDVLDPEDDIVIFGLSNISRAAIKELDGYRVTAFVDNNPKKEGLEVDGILVHSPKYLTEHRENIIILVMSRYYRSICEQLMYMGYELGKQVFIVNDTVFKEISRETVKKQIMDRIRSGEIIYNELREKYKNETICINPHSGTGDVYYSWIYLKGERVVLLVSTGSCRKLAALLGMNVVKMTREEISSLVAYGRYAGMDKSGLRLLNYSFEQYVTERMRGFKGVDYNTMLQKTVFFYAKRAEPKRIPQIDTERRFDGSGMKKSGTVLLSPYAGTADSVPWSFWLMLAARLKDMGYSVCTNVCGDEKPVDGTDGISLDYSEVLDFTDRAGYFIGLRSGLCDILSVTAAKMVVIYPDQMYSAVSDYYSYFSIKKMGMRENDLLEIIWKDDEEIRCIKEIEHFFIDRINVGSVVL